MIQRIAQLVRHSRLDLSSEKAAQHTFGMMLDLRGIPFEREVQLSKSDIVDFMVGDLAVELKLKGARKKPIYDQLKRYARHDQVQSIALLSNVSMGLPEELEGKDVYFLRLGEGWL